MSDPTTPPPPAQPFGGQPAQPYGGQPGQPFGAAPQPEGQLPQYGAMPPQKKSGAGKKVLSILGTLVVVLVVIGLKLGLGGAFDKDETAETKVGDCIGALPQMAEGETKEADAEVVKCDDASAQYSVVGRVENLTEAKAQSDSVCTPYKEAEASYLVTKDGKKYYVLCLKPVAKK